MNATTYTCRTGMDKVEETLGDEGIPVRGEAARKSQEKLGDPEFGPWLAQASILIIDDEPGMRNFLVRTLGPLCKRIEEAADTEEASRKLDANYSTSSFSTTSCLAATAWTGWPNSARSDFSPTQS